MPWGTHLCPDAETLVAATVLQACRYLDHFDVSAAIESCYHVVHRTSMEKDFDRWNRHKKKVNDAADRPFYHAREIWWCGLAPVWWRGEDFRSRYLI